ncbi:MAG: hypothetical protein ACREOG_15270, partial [Gemmatimonadaceae bacterium]
MVAARVTGESPRLDGRLEDAAWRLASPVSDFAQQRPLELAQPTERTEVMIVYDDNALYVGARLYRRNP